MRRSLDFGTITGSLSTLRSASSTSSNGAATASSPSESHSPGGSRFGTIAGLPTSPDFGNSNGNGFDTLISRPKSSLSHTQYGNNKNGGGKGKSKQGRGNARAHFALGGLFSVGQARSSKNAHAQVEGEEIDQDDDEGSNVPRAHDKSQDFDNPRHSQSVNDASSRRSPDSANPSSPETPTTERENALMKAVNDAKANDAPWEIAVHPARREGLFLEYGSSRKDRKIGGRAGVTSPEKEKEGSGLGLGLGLGFMSSSMSFGALSRKWLGRSTPKSQQENQEEDDGPMTSTPPHQTKNGHDALPSSLPSNTTKGESSDASEIYLNVPLSPDSKLKRRLESSEEDISPLHLRPITASTSQRAYNATSASSTDGNAIVDADQLLVLYVTTATSSLTLYRKLGEVIRLDNELRKHFVDYMPIAPRPSILSTSLSGSSSAYGDNTQATYGHARKKSVLSSLTRTFTSPSSASRRVSPTANLSTTASQISIGESSASQSQGTTDITSSGAASDGTPAAPAAIDINPSHKQAQMATSPQFSILQSQLSNLSDYLSSLSCILAVRSSKHWIAFFKPTREDHESSHLETVAAASSSYFGGQGITPKARRLKRMKSATELESRGGTLSSHASLLQQRPSARQAFESPSTSTNGETPSRKNGRIDDSGIGIMTPATVGSASSHGRRDVGHGHQRETSSATPSVIMRRDVSTGTTNTTTSAMSLFIEHTEDHNQEVVGDPEVLQYMERLRQESEARMALNAFGIPTKAKDVTEPRAKEADQQQQQSKQDYIPPTPVSLSGGAAEHDTGSPQTADTPVIEEEMVQEITPPTLLEVYSPSDEPVLAALEESLQADEVQLVDNAELPPLSGMTAVDSKEGHFEPEEEHLQARIVPAASTSSSAHLLSPESATFESDSRSTSPVSTSIKSRKEKKKRKKSDASLRRRRKSSANFSERTRSRNSSIRIEDFEILRVLGKGCAGKVLLARLKEGQDITTHSTHTARTDAAGQLYAIKAIHKHHVLAHRELAHTLTEQSILRKMVTEASTPFVVRMRWSFQDTDNLFLVLDFHPGGDLATQLSRWGRLGKDRTRFYAAEIIEGLENLHQCGIIYRDLKPENILLAADGHIVLTDFGLSKQFYRPVANGEREHADDVSLPSWLKPEVRRTSTSSSTLGGVRGSPQETTATFCGTAEYLAPEVLLGVLYSYPVDMWSLGTMIYEMLLGVTPFYNEDHGIMYRRVLHEDLTFGNGDYLDGDTRSLLRGLLQKAPEFRMTTARAKKAKYFEAIDWQFIRTKRYIPPFIPALSPDDPADTQNFEACFLTMDLGFVDEKDIEEAEAKAKSSGKEPDKPFDEEGRDVFANYGFDGAWAEPESDDDPITEEEENSEAEDVASIQPSPSAAHPEEHPGIVQGEADAVGSGVDDADPPSMVSNITSPSTQEMNDTSDEQAYETGLTSTSTTNDEASKVSEMEEDTAPPSAAVHEDGLPPLQKIQEEEGHEDLLAHDGPISSSPRSLVDMYPERPPSPTLDTTHNSRASIEMPRGSIDHDEWDVVEVLSNDDVADNGTRGTRKRLMAGTNLFAKGVVDRYKLQLKPQLKPSTPTRSVTARSALTRLASGTSQMTRTRSNRTSNQLSPAPSIGGMSETPSSVDSTEAASPVHKKTRNQNAARRMATPRLLRVSTEWMSSSLPSSPTPKFRIKRSKKGTAPEMSPAQSSLQQERPILRKNDVRSADSLATLSGEQASFGLQPLTRQTSRDQNSA